MNDTIFHAFQDELEKIAMAAIAFGRKPHTVGQGTKHVKNDEWYVSRNYTHPEARAAQRLGPNYHGGGVGLGSGVGHKALRDRMDTFQKTLAKIPIKGNQNNPRNPASNYLGRNNFYIDVKDGDNRLGYFALSDMLQDTNPKLRMRGHRIDTVLAPSMGAPRGFDLAQSLAKPERKMLRAATKDLVEGLKADRRAVVARQLAAAARRAK